jgi:hypothetical protein
VHVANIAAAWYKNTMRTDLRPSHLHRVCEQHFEESCFDCVGDGTKVLKPKSLPTLFDLEVFYKMIAYQESNKTIKKTNITFHTSNPEIDERTLEPILRMNLDSGHVKTRLASTMAVNESEHEQTDKNQPAATVNKASVNHHEYFDNKASNRCHVDGCAHNYVARRHRVQLYKISRDLATARQWLDACGFENVPMSVSTTTFKVCREHFTQNDFEGPTTLRADAVPSLFTTYSRSLMDKQNPTSAKRFRSDAVNARAKLPAMNHQNRRSNIPYRNNNSYARPLNQETMNVSLSPVRDNPDDPTKATMDDAKLANEIDLTMNCFDEQLSDTQAKHWPVKVHSSYDDDESASTFRFPLI